MLEAAFTDVLDYTERGTRETLRALPDGVYRAAGEIEGDGFADVDIPLRVAVTLFDSRECLVFANQRGWIGSMCKVTEKVENGW